MSTVLYTVASREMPFDGTHNVEDMHKDSDYWYEGNDREKIARARAQILE